MSPWLQAEFQAHTPTPTQTGIFRNHELVRELLASQNPNNLNIALIGGSVEEVATLFLLANRTDKNFQPKNINISAVNVSDIEVQLLKEGVVEYVEYEVGTRVNDDALHFDDFERLDLRIVGFDEATNHHRMSTLQPELMRHFVARSIISTDTHVVYNRESTIDFLEDLEGEPYMNGEHVSISVKLPDNLLPQVSIQNADVTSGRVKFTNQPNVICALNLLQHYTPEGRNRIVENIKKLSGPHTIVVLEPPEPAFDTNDEHPDYLGWLNDYVEWRKSPPGLTPTNLFNALSGSPLAYKIS